MLPGLNATNMSVYVGERLRGVAGAIVAALGMILPGAVIVRQNEPSLPCSPRSSGSSIPGGLRKTLQ